MKTTTEPIPSVIDRITLGDPSRGSVSFWIPCPWEQAGAMAVKLQRAYNHYDALCAVAEAATKIDRMISDGNGDGINKASLALDAALGDLAAIRNKI